MLILLHGLPEFRWGWRRQIGPLAEAGWHVVAPDMRGCNLSDAPDGVEACRLDVLAADVLAPADAFGADRFDLVGHDWGAVVAWWVAATRPARLRRPVGMCGPHPDVWAAQALRHPTQGLRSTYVGLFQPPWAPEATLGAFDVAGLKAMMRTSAHGGTFEPGALGRYAEAWARPRGCSPACSTTAARSRGARPGPSPARRGATAACPASTSWNGESQAGRRFACANLEGRAGRPRPGRRDRPPWGARAPQGRAGNGAASARLGRERIHEEPRR